jgi:ABC-type transport system involved in cytochrome c biogenesis permease component
MTREVSEPFVPIVIIAIIVLPIGIPIMAFSFGRAEGLKTACESIQAEWRDSKCVRVVVEDVK